MAALVNQAGSRNCLAAPSGWRRLIVAGRPEAFTVDKPRHSERTSRRSKVMIFACLLALLDSVMARDAKLFRAARDGTPDEVLAVLWGGVSVDTRDRYRQTPLMYTAAANTPEVLRTLVEIGADVNARTGAGWTALMYAGRDNPDPAVLLMLLELGADPRGVLFEHYVNDRFGYSLDLPIGLLVPQPVPTNNDGRSFTLPNGLGSISVWGSHNALEEAVEESLERASAGREVTYSVTRDTWFVVSGYEEGRIFYEKTFVTVSGTATVLLNYDPAARALFDPMTERVVASLIPADPNVP